MALITCRECQALVSEEAAKCPHCGAPRALAKKKRWPWILGVVLALFAAAMMAPRGPEVEAKRRARGAIELCWEDQQRKSLAPVDQRFIAGLCERMEADFQQKYGVRP